MNFTINLPPGVAARLARRAKREGRDLEGYVEELAAREAGTETPTWPPTVPPTAAARAETFQRWAEGRRTSGPVPPLSAFDRENLYGDDDQDPVP